MPSADGRRTSVRFKPRPSHKPARLVRSEVNIAIGNRSAKRYFTELAQQCSGWKLRYGAICDHEQLEENFKMNCIPDGMDTRELALR
jgi:hypothetical protein